uniref:Diguanylate cyclase n=1 Tax=Bradyrhizobium symbiodeficiens TaxID=1404367 RepID=A0A6G9A6C7_9BRAD|nr:diguanylate cyclase [Bradyrhizobium symbiodeficiens]
MLLNSSRFGERVARAGLVDGLRCRHVRIHFRKFPEEHINFLATHDALTGVPNRSMFKTMISDAHQRASRARGHQFAVLFVDLDRFKLINDSLGQPRATTGLMHRSKKLYSITSSARTSNEGGTVRPSALAVFMLITSSNLVGLSTGNSEGLVPLSILSTMLPARRIRSLASTPYTDNPPLA